MLTNKIIEKITSWLDENPKIEILYRKKQEEDLYKEDTIIPFPDELFQLWLKEAEAEDTPLVLIDFQDRIELYIADTNCDDDNCFIGYLICTYMNDSIKISNNFDRIEINKSLWYCSLGIISPNEIVPYEQISDLELDLEDNSKNSKEIILNNYEESNYVDFFLSPKDNNYNYGFITITDFNGEIMNYKDFSDLIMDETRVSFQKYENNFDLDSIFSLYYYLNQELKPLTENNFKSVIEIPKIIVFFVENEVSAIKLYRQMINRINERELKIKKKTKKHQEYVESLMD